MRAASKLNTERRHGRADISGQPSVQGGQSAPSTAGEAMGGSTQQGGQPQVGGDPAGTSNVGGVASSGGTPQAGGSMTGPVGPPAMENGSPVPAQSEQLSSVGFIRFTQLDSERVIGQTRDGIALVMGQQRTPIDGSFGEFLEGARVANMNMVLTTAGLFVLVDDRLEASPLADAIPRVTTMTVHPQNALWLATEQGLYRWSDGSVRRLMTNDAQLDWSNVRLSPGYLYSTPVVWAVEGTTVVAIGVSDSGPQAWSFELTEAATGTATTKDGLWVAGRSRLSLLSNTGEWAVWKKPTDVSVLSGHVAAEDLWLSNGRTLWQWRNNQLRARTDSPIHTSLQVNEAGSALVSNLTGLYTVVSGRFVNVDGLSARVTGDVALTIKPSEAELVESVSASMDGGESMQIDGPPWTMDLPIAMVQPGNHTFHVEVRYTDGQQANTTIDFLGPPSWAQDIDPLQQVHCVRCHGQGGSAHLMMDAATWELEIAEIVDDVETGRMPLNGSTLTQDEIDLIRGWRDAGFLE